nr:alpha/beta hydrolase [Lysinibacter cavernae]
MVAALLAGCSVSIVPLDDSGSSSNLDGVPENLKDLYGQDLKWKTCEGDLECATATAPINWDEPDGDTIELAMVRHPASDGKPMGSLFVNPGGPGGSGYDFVVNGVDGGQFGDALVENYDIVGFDPRGVNNSTPVSCYDDQQMDEFLFGISTEKTGTDAWLAEMRESAKDFGDACLENTGALLEFVDTVSAAKDLDLMRALVGDEKLNYLGYSYGTFLGAHYAELFPENVGRLVLDGAIDPSVSNFEVVKTQTVGFENAMRAYLEDCLAKKGCPFTGTVDEAMATVASLLDSVEQRPLTASDGRKLGSGALLTAIIFPLYSQDMWSYLTTMFEDVMAGNADYAFLLADSYYGRGEDGYLDNSFESFFAINCLDYEYNDDDAKMKEEAAELAAAAPTLGRFQGYGDIGCAEWPFKNRTPREPIHAEGAAPILVIGTTNDPATPYEWAVSLADQLDSGILVTYEGEGHTAYSPSNTCVAAIVEDYFVEDAVPSGSPTC